MNMTRRNFLKSMGAVILLSAAPSMPAYMQPAMEELQHDFTSYNSLIPTGYIFEVAFQSAISALHINALPCNGAVLKVSKYQKLFNAIGRVNNTGNEKQDEFRLPDFQSKLIKGGVIDARHLTLHFIKY